MTVGTAMVAGLLLGFLACFLWLYFGKISQIQAEYQFKISELQQNHQQQLVAAQKRSVNSSRAVLKGKLAEQFAPILPEFPYLPSDAKFLGDPIDYVIFSGYSEFREGLITADQLEVVFVDIKSGRAKLHKGQQAIAQTIAAGRVRFETIHIDF